MWTKTSAGRDQELVWWQWWRGTLRKIGVSHNYITVWHKIFLSDWYFSPQRTTAERAKINKVEAKNHCVPPVVPGWCRHYAVPAAGAGLGVSHRRKSPGRAVRARCSGEAGRAERSRLRCQSSVVPEPGTGTLSTSDQWWHFCAGLMETFVLLNSISSKTTSELSIYLYLYIFMDNFRGHRYKWNVMSIFNSAVIVTCTQVCPVCLCVFKIHLIDLTENRNPLWTVAPVISSLFHNNNIWI